MLGRKGQTDCFKEMLHITSKLHLMACDLGWPQRREGIVEGWKLFGKACTVNIKMLL